MRLGLCVLICLVAPVVARGEPHLRDGIVAIVNDAIITRQQLEDYTLPAIEVLRRTYARNPDVFNRKYTETIQDGLEQLIEKQLILDEFKSAGGQLPESIIEEEVRDRIRKNFGDRVTLTKSLRARGESTESFRKRVHDDIIINFMRQKNVSSAITISPTRIEHYYATNQPEFKVDDQVKLRMIKLTRSEGNSAEELLSMAREIMRKLDDGTSFAEMAAIYSKDAQAKEGGDWGWYERSKLNKGLAEIAATLQPSQRSGVIGLSREGDSFWVSEYDRKGQFALGRKYNDKGDFLDAKRFDLSSGADPPSPEEVYLMMVEDKRPEHVRPLAEVRDEIEKNLIVQERGRLHAKWIDRIKAKSFVVKYY
jgi:parvulin-like peptidyl-prolyl isomerase